MSNKKHYFLSDKNGSILKFIFMGEKKIKLNFQKNKNGKLKESIEITPSDFIAIKGFEAIGKQLSQNKIKSIELIKNQFNEDISKKPSKYDELNESSGQIMMDFN